MQEVDVVVAAAKLPELLKAVDAGSAFVITVHGVPCAELIPARTRQPGQLVTTVEGDFFQSLSPDELDVWEG